MALLTVKATDFTSISGAQFTNQERAYDNQYSGSNTFALASLSGSTNQRQTRWTTFDLTGLPNYLTIDRIDIKTWQNVTASDDTSRYFPRMRVRVGAQVSSNYSLTVLVGTTTTNITAQTFSNVSHPGGVAWTRAHLADLAIEFDFSRTPGEADNNLRLFEFEVDITYTPENAQGQVVTDFGQGFDIVATASGGLPVPPLDALIDHARGVLGDEVASCLLYRRVPVIEMGTAHSATETWNAVLELHSILSGGHGLSRWIRTGTLNQMINDLANRREK